jgi:predicted amidohydrolase YtcJ
VINGLDIGYWAHAADIDAALSTGGFASQPIVLFGSDEHTAWANRAARIRAGITAKYIKSLKSSEQRYFGFDAAFNPNGFVVDEGKTKLDKSLPSPSPESMLEAGRAAVHYMNGLGITAWLDAAGRSRRRTRSPLFSRRKPARAHRAFSTPHNACRGSPCSMPTPVIPRKRWISCPRSARSKRASAPT